MMELGELEQHHADFEKKNARIIAISMDNQEDAKKTQDKFPDLVILADPNSELIGGIKAVTPHAGPGGIDAAAPTTIILDKEGKIRWTHREDRFISRPSPSEILAALDKNVPN
jgi:peroxiredoxin